MMQIVNNDSNYNTHCNFNLIDGRDYLTCVIKAAWQFDGHGQLTRSKNLPAIEETDRYYGEPNKSSLCAAREIMPFKPGSEFYLYGTARPASTASTVAEVGVGIKWPDAKSWEKKLRVFGARRWQSMLMGHIPGKPGILKPLPLRYEFAYGGQDPQGKKQFYPANPAGIGFTESRGVSALAMPQIENSTQVVNKITDRPQPAGFAPVPIAWQLTAPATAESLTSPCMAPVDQRFERAFAGGEKNIVA